MREKLCSRRTALKSGIGVLGGSTLIGAGSTTATANDRDDWDWENPEWNNQDDNVDLNKVEEGGRDNDNGILGEVTDGIEHYDFKGTSITGDFVWEIPLVIESTGVLNDPDGDPMERIDHSWIRVDTTGDTPVSMDFSTNDHHMGSYTYANDPDDGSLIDSQYTQTAIEVSLAAASIKYPVLSAPAIASSLLFSYEHGSSEDTYSFDAEWDYNYAHSDADRESQYSAWACFFLKLEPSQQTTFEVNSGWRVYDGCCLDMYPRPEIEYEVTVTAPSSDGLYPGNVDVNRLN